MVGFPITEPVLVKVVLLLGAPLTLAVIVADARILAELSVSVTVVAPVVPGPGEAIVDGLSESAPLGSPEIASWIGAV